MAWIPKSGDAGRVGHRKFDLHDEAPPPVEKISLPASWQWGCPVTLRAIVEETPKLTHAELLARIDEAIQVDRRVHENERAGGSGWLDGVIRDNYLASIIRGTISTGS